MRFLPTHFCRRASRTSASRNPHPAVYRKRYAPTFARARSAPPDLFRQLDDHAQLRPLFVGGENVAFLGRSKSALRRERELVERHDPGRLLDALLDVVARLQPPGLGCDDAEHDDLVAFRQEAQRLETAGALAVVFE